MPFSTVKLLPGVKAEVTPTLNEAGISSSNMIRFLNGLPQKLGGWTIFNTGNVFSIPRALCAWEDLNSAFHLGIGTDASVGVVTDGFFQDTSPGSTTTNPAVDFSTVSGSNIVTIVDTGSNTTIYDVIILETPVSIGGLVLYGVYPVVDAQSADQYQIDASALATATVSNAGAVPSYTTVSSSSRVTVTLDNHGYSVGSTYAAPVSTTVGGLTIQGLFYVVSVTDANNFVIGLPNLATASTSASMNGGDAQIVYWIASAPSPPGSGYGDVGYGEGGYGSGIAPPSHVGTEIGATNFSMFNWGSTFVYNPTGYGIFIWSPTSGLRGGQLLAIDPNTPVACTGIFLAMPEQQIVAYGASVLGVLDPMLVAWCDNGNYNVWTAAVSNQAGTFRLTRGSRIVGGLQGPQQALLWTDVGLWAMQYIGYPLVYGFNEIAQGCGLIAKEAAAVLGETVFWMSQRGFFTLAAGAVAPIPCDVWDVIFQNINVAEIAKIRAAPNSQFNEVSWFFTSASSGATENDTYVKYNVVTGVWDYGTLSRSCWIDQNVFGPPMGGGPGTGSDWASGWGSDWGGSVYALIYQHETAPDAASAAIDSWFETGFFMLSDGEDKVFIDYAIPDFKYGPFGASLGATMQITLYVADFPEDTPNVFGPYSITETTRSFAPRCRGRYMAMKVESDDLGSWWRMGGCKFRFAVDGRN